MKTLDLNLERDRRHRGWALIAIVVVLNLCGCSDSPTAPGDGASPGLVATITSSPVLVGDLVRLTFTPTHPCWNEDAEMEVLLSWNAARFAWVDTSGIRMEQAGGGRFRFRGMDRDGFGGGMHLAFRALADGSTADFVVNEVMLRCESATLVDLHEPPLLAATNP